eukprot:jgi/Ulvmu1/1362/UM011_0090.1
MKIKVNVKWNKEIYKDVEVDLEEPPEMFKIQLMSLTGVPIERQKVLTKGGRLGDSEWGKVVLKDGMTIMMMGTAEVATLPEKSEEPQFVEDLPEKEQDAVDTRQYGAGLENLGNTCYMNACLQCLYKVPELREALKTASTSNAPLTREASKLFIEMAKGVTVSPFAFWAALRSEVPQFDEMAASKVPGGGRGFKQQDAEECWTALLSKWRPPLARDGADIISSLFQMKLKVTLKCMESEETTQDELEVFTIKCNITGEINHLHEGIRLGLVEDREKRSEGLQRTAAWQGEARLSTLPAYLTIQVVRFFYKVQLQQKAKIRRKVAFPLQLDMLDFCTDELKTQLRGPRAALRRIEDEKAGVVRTEADNEAGDATDADGDAVMGGGGREDYTGALTGRYNLLAVLTHKGRTPDSGHYVAWVKQEDGIWVQFDDEKMIPRKDEDLLELAGGGDWHTSYVMLWKPQRVPASSNESAPPAEEG